MDQMQMQMMAAAMMVAYAQSDGQKTGAAPTPTPPPPPPPDEQEQTPLVDSSYGYSTGVFGQKNRQPALAPPPPPPLPKSGLGTNDDIPMPPEYSYPRFLEPEIDRQRRQVEWMRPNKDTAAEALSKAADRAAKINSKLGAKPASSIRPDPFFDVAKHEAMMGAEVTYAMPGGRYDKTKEGIANVPFTAQQEMRRTQMLQHQALGVGAFGNQGSSIRGAPVKWNKKTKRYEERMMEEQVDWAMTHHYRKLAQPVAGSLTMAPKEEPKVIVEPPPLPYCNGQMVSRNDYTRPPGLAGQCLDDDVASEDELLDVHMRPKYHFWHGKTWAECIDPIKKLKLAGCRPWNRGKQLTAELDPSYVKQLKINRARAQALKMLEEVTTEQKPDAALNPGLAASADPVLNFVREEVKSKITSNAQIPPPPPMDARNLGYHGQDVINQTDILTWTSKRGHTNAQTPQGQGIAQAGVNFDPTNKKRAAPLEWHFVSEQNYTVERQTRNAQAPGIGPALNLDKTDSTKQKEPERARFVPLDIDTKAAESLLGLITSDKCDVCSKSFIKNESARTAHLQSKPHFKKLNTWLRTRNFKEVLYKE